MLPKIRVPRFETTVEVACSLMPTISCLRWGLLNVRSTFSLAAGQAWVVAHVAAHELGAAVYAIKAVIAAAPDGEEVQSGVRESRWQQERLPDAIRDWCSTTSGCAVESAGLGLPCPRQFGAD